MLCLSRKIDYALVALGHLSERDAGTVASAREIAVAAKLPLPLLMKIMKRLHRAGVLASVRGAKGGYRLAADVERLNLYSLVGIVEDDDPMERRHRHGPVQAFQFRLVRSLKDVKVSDLTLPGRRIDVPLESVGSVSSV